MDFRPRREDHDAIARAYLEDLDRNDGEYAALLVVLQRLIRQALEDEADGTSDDRFDVRHDRYKDGPEL
jgi:hypothetical protein